MNNYLPISRADMEERGITQFDFVYIIGDAYVDHPSFGPAIISRVLEDKGYSVGIIAQPDWNDDKSIDIYGEPRLAFLVCSGNMDSMVNHYSVSKKRRERDAYTPGGVAGKRPDYAVSVYCRLIRKSYPDAPIVIGGIEASLRRFAHYDYWSDSLKPSVLMESGADLLLYGMGERSIAEVAYALNNGISVADISFVAGTSYRLKNKDMLYQSDGDSSSDERTSDHLKNKNLLYQSAGQDSQEWGGVLNRELIFLPSYAKLRKDKKNYADSFEIQYKNTDPFSGKRLVEEYENGALVVQNPPAMPLSQRQMDQVYALPYMRNYHPSYEVLGGIPAIEEVKFSLISSRGCFGGCNFCALSFHQGRIIQSRSHASILAESELLTEDEDFKGYIHDVGGPTANFREPSCEKQLKEGICINKRCLFPEPCKNLKASHADYLSLLRKLRKLPKVKKVFIRSGIRYDYLMADADKSFFRELVEHHVSGQLKVAPEHIADGVLVQMGKPKSAEYLRFVRAYQMWNEKLHKNQYLVPYMMSSHPGSGLKEAIELAEYFRDIRHMPEQVQDFYPTPSTVSTCIYYTGIDPFTKQAVYVAKNPHEKAMQRALIQYRNPKNYHLVAEALKIAGREDLIGYGKYCLIRPREEGGKRNDKSDRSNRGKGKEKRTCTGGNEKKKSTSQKLDQDGKSRHSQNQNQNKKKTIRTVHKKKK